MRTKTWLITASAFILLGFMILGGVLTVAKWDFTRLSTVTYETNEYHVDEDYQSVRVITDTADVTFVPSADGTTSVHCFEETRMRHTVEVRNGTLEVELNDTRKWYDYIGIHFGKPRITVYLPAGTYETFTVKVETGDVNIPPDFTLASATVTGHTGDVDFAAPATGEVALKTTTGHIEVQNVTAGSLSLTASTGKLRVAGVTCQGDVTLKVSTGKTRITDLTCQNLTSNGSTGDLLLEHVVTRGRLAVERDTGDVLFDRCDAAELFVATTTGDVKGSLLSDKVFITATDTGRIDVPKTTVGGRCEIVTDTGDIILTTTH